MAGPDITLRKRTARRTIHGINLEAINTEQPASLAGSTCRPSHQTKVAPETQRCSKANNEAIKPVNRFSEEEPSLPVHGHQNEPFESPEFDNPHDLYRR